MEARVISTSFAAGQIGNATAMYCGFSLRDVGTGCVVNIRDGSGGVILDALVLAANQCMGDLYVAPIMTQTSIFVELVSGTAPVGCIRWR